MLRRGFLRDERGAAAVEFAMIAPVGVLLVIGVVDLTRAVVIQQEVTDAAHSIPVMASVIALQTDRSTSLTVVQVQQSLSGIFTKIPWLRSGSLTGATAAIMSSVDFTQANPNCNPATGGPCAAYPHVAWSVAYQPPGGRSGMSNSFESAVRPCMQLNQAAATAKIDGDLTSIRTAGVTYTVPALAPMLVVDIHYRYTPIFFNVLTGPIDFWASGYWPTRIYNPNAPSNRQYTAYDVAGQAGGAGKCSGYP